ncbi:ecdysteroid kinase domain-containing protein [Phthorimaea operculella]|nr:ecdysteroid kinase domain-containing protein [Phthorimaea operculella]
MQIENKPSDKAENIISVEDIFPAEHLHSIDDIIAEEGYTKYQLTKTKICNTNSFQGDLYAVDIKGETANGFKETNIFVKISVPDINNKITSVSEIYKKECYFYKGLSKIITSLQDEAKVPADERFVLAKSYETTNDKALFLENLAKKGFKAFPHGQIMPLQYAELAVQHLAKFHGLFYVIEKKMPDYFQSNLRGLKPCFIFNDDWNEFVLNSSKFSIAALNGETKKKIEDCFPEFQKKFESFMLDTSSIGSIICHGDYHVGNILVKETDAKFTDLVLVDYQTLHYGNPLKDLVYFIIGASDQEFRKHHLNDLKNLYYDHLKQFLGYFQFDVNDIYSRVEFEKLFKDTLEFGFICWFFWLPYQFSKEDQISENEENDLLKVDFSLSAQFRDRIQGLVDDMIQWGYL